MSRRRSTTAALPLAPEQEVEVAVQLFGRPGLDAGCHFHVVPLLAKFGLLAHLNVPAGTFSAGMRRRCGRRPGDCLRAWHRGGHGASRTRQRVAVGLAGDGERGVFLLNPRGASTSCVAPTSAPGKPALRSTCARGGGPWGVLTAGRCSMARGSAHEFWQHLRKSPARRTEARLVGTCARPRGRCGGL
jgi:hypothetical protein